MLLNRTLSESLLPLLGICSVAIALPLLGTLAEGPAFFIAHAAPAFDIIGFVLLIYLVPTALLLALLLTIQVAGGPALWQVVRSAMFTLLIAAWVMSLTQPLPTAVAIGVSTPIAIFAARNLSSGSWALSLLTLVGQLSPAIPLYFLLLSPLSNLLIPEPDLAPIAVAGTNTAVVFLVFDELPLAAILQDDGEIDATRLPNFFRLQQLSTWYRDAITVSTHTHRAIAAILSAKQATQNTLPILSQHPQNLFTMMAPGGKVVASESISRLCPEEICAALNDATNTTFVAREMYRDAWFIWLHSVLPPALAGQYLPALAGKWRGFGADTDDEKTSAKSFNTATAGGYHAQYTQKLRKFSDAIAGGETQLNYLHIPLPHHPWIYLPDGTVYNGQDTAATTFSHDWKKDPQLVDQALLRFHLQVEYVDGILGEVLDRLEASKQFEKTLLVVVSDHGLAIAAGEKRRAPTATTLADVARVPLFIKYPNQNTAATDTRRIQTIDILPTIADALKLSLTEQVDGQSLLDANWQPTRRHVFEAAASITDADSAMDLSRAISRFRRVLESGKSALETWSRGSAGERLGIPTPSASPKNKAFQLELDHPDWYHKIEPNSGYLPVRITGTLRGAGRGVEVLIGLNGIIAGGNVTFDKRGSLSVMLQPSFFQPGVNNISAYVLNRGELEQIDLRSQPDPTWVVRRDNAGIISVIDSNGTAYQRDDANGVEESRSGAAVLSRGTQLMAVVGRAFDKESATTPDFLLLTSGTNIVTQKFRAYPGRRVLDAMSKSWLAEFSVEFIPLQTPPGAAFSVLALWKDGSLLEIPVVNEAKCSEADNNMAECRQ